MTHLWVRAEQRQHEERVGLSPKGASRLMVRGIKVTVEESPSRAIAVADYADMGCEIAPYGSWTTAPKDAIIFGLKELPDDGTPLPHRHIMFGHAFKGQSAGRKLLDRFKAGGGALYDLEYLTGEDGRRVAAFGYWAGYAGAAISVMCWSAQQRGEIAGPVQRFANKDALLAALRAEFPARMRPLALIVGALGRVGTGASDLCEAMGIPVTKWDVAQTAHGGPFPQILAHEIFLNCILASPGCPVFVPESALKAPRNLSMIGDIACDPTSEFSPIKVYNWVTDWDRPALRVHENPVLDVMAIDNLPSLLPIEASEDYAAQLLPSLMHIADIDTEASNTVWGRARAVYLRHV
jgi:saccharopine dehydrogenase (NAD+, L-lysine-forming)